MERLPDVVSILPLPPDGASTPGDARELVIKNDCSVFSSVSYHATTVTGSSAVKYSNDIFPPHAMRIFYGVSRQRDLFNHVGTGFSDHFDSTVQSDVETAHAPLTPSVFFCESKY